MKTIRLWDGIRVTTADGSEIAETLRDLWDLFGWDTKNDPAAKEAAANITVGLFCYGHVDLTEANGGDLLVLTAVPAKEA